MADQYRFNLNSFRFSRKLTPTHFEDGSGFHWPIQVPRLWCYLEKQLASSFGTSMYVKSLAVALSLMVLSSCAGTPPPRHIDTNPFNDAATKKLGVPWPDDKRVLLDSFRKVLEDVDEHYVRPISTESLETKAIAAINTLPEDPDADHLTDVAIAAVMQSLDPNSYYLNLGQWRKLVTAFAGGPVGQIGVEARLQDGALVITQIDDDSPASKAGLLPNDLITKIDGTPISTLRSAGTYSPLLGPVGAKLLLTVQRKGMALFELPIVLARLDRLTHSVVSVMDDHTLYLRIGRFVSTTTKDLHAALVASAGNADGALKGVVLDLRNNPGGLLDQAVSVAGEFLDSGDIVTARGRTQRDYSRYKAVRGEFARHLRLVAIVNENTCEGAEIVAGALKDNHRAILVGRHTLGHGSIQTVFPLPNGGVIYLTTSYFFRPSGLPIEGAGIEPDLSVAWDSSYDVESHKTLFGDPTKDLQYIRARAILEDAPSEEH